MLAGGMCEVGVGPVLAQFTAQPVVTEHPVAPRDPAFVGAGTQIDNLIGVS